MKCLDHNGTAYVFTSNDGDPRWLPGATLLRASRTTSTVLYRGAARSIAFGTDVGYINEGRWGEEISRINLRSGQVTPVITGPRYTTRLVLSPDGSALATHVWGDDLTRVRGDDSSGSRPPQAVVIELEPSPPQVRTTVLGHTNQTVPGNMVWLDADRIGFVPDRGDNVRAIIFDRSLRELGGIDNWSAWASLLVGDVIIGVGQGSLRVADLPNGPPRMLKQLDSPQTITLAALPGVTPDLQAARPETPPATRPEPPRAARPETPEDADLPILPLAASAAAIALLTGLYFVNRRRRRSADT